MAQLIDTLLVAAAARCRPPRREEAVALLSSKAGNRCVFGLGRACVCVGYTYTHTCTFSFPPRFIFSTTPTQIQLPRPRLRPFARGGGPRDGGGALVAVPIQRAAPPGAGPAVGGAMRGEGAGTGMVCRCFA